MMDLNNYSVFKADTFQSKSYQAAQVQEEV